MKDLIRLMYFQVRADPEARHLLMDLALLTEEMLDRPFPYLHVPSNDWLARRLNTPLPVIERAAAVLVRLGHLHIDEAAWTVILNPRKD